MRGSRVHDPERLDDPEVPRDRLAASLDQVARVNRWLGGRRGLERHLRPLRSAGCPVRLLDVGTGNGATARELLARGGDGWRGVGLDRSPTVLSVATSSGTTGRSHSGSRSGAGDASATELSGPLSGAPRLAKEGSRTEAGQAEPGPDEAPAGRPGAPDGRLSLVAGEAERLPFRDGSFDVALCTLTLHHFRDAEAVRVVSEMGRVARRLVLVSDLERHPLHLLGARLLARTLWRRDPVTRHDGPLSVRRSFRPDELLEVGRRAGLRAARVHRHFFFRLVLEGRPPGPGAGETRTCQEAAP